VTAGRRSNPPPGLAAITVSPHGGGIAAVSRLVRRVLVDEYGPVPQFMLARSARRFDTGAWERIQFGTQIALSQARGRCDWIFYTHLNLATVQAFVPRALRRPYAVFLHDVEAWTPLGPRMREVLAGASLRLANSSFTARRVVDANPGCGAVRVCPLALPPADVGEPVASPTLDATTQVVVIVGRMVASERYKGHDQLIEAWHDVVAAVPGARLVCVGEGDDTARLEAKVRSSGLANVVGFTGFLDEGRKRAMLESAAVMALPSRREGFGLVYLEAMAAGVPCLGSIHDAAAEVVVDGETGVLVNLDSPGVLGAALVGLLTNHAKRRRLGEAGRERYQRLFTYDAFRARLMSEIHAAFPQTTDRGPFAPPVRPL
jgi:phosphatidylinositol alpha-1,6-mannosyltransferase